MFHSIDKECESEIFVVVERSVVSLYHVVFDCVSQIE
jgi:hypothetical protein